MNMGRGILLDLIYPPRCVFCGRHGRRGACRDCEARLPWRSVPLREGKGYGRCFVPLEYRGIVRTAVREFKFRGRASLADGLGALLAQCVESELHGAFDVAAWVPLSEQRLRERGYDQARLLARAVTRTWGRRPAALLEKQRDCPPQSGEDAAGRQENVSGAYRAICPRLTQQARILLIDDVITSGATLAECRRTLLEAGAASVECACLASARFL